MSLSRGWAAAAIRAAQPEAEAHPERLAGWKTRRPEPAPRPVRPVRPLAPRPVHPVECSSYEPSGA